MPNGAAKGSRALVLGGGGVVGIAWETGVITALAHHGVDVRLADLIVGTSAGATVGAQITSPTELDTLLATQISGASREPPIDLDMAAIREQILAILAADGTPEARRRVIGELALAIDRVPEAERRTIIESRLPSAAWPGTDLKVVAIDAHSGVPIAFDRDSGVPLVDAVAASCAIPVVWPAVTIGDHRYYDGGLRSPVNADIARGFERVLILQPGSFPENDDVAPLGPESDVRVVVPDDASIAAMGTDALDPGARPACARAGYAQGSAAAKEIARFWR